jgi:hypothetical protein
MTIRRPVIAAALAISLFLIAAPVALNLVVVGTAYGKKIVAVQGRPLPGGFGEGAGAPAPPGAGFPGMRGRRVSLANTDDVGPPHASKAHVIELLEDDAGMLTRCLNADADSSSNKAGAWGDDCFSGACCLKVAGYQRYRQHVPGWGFPVVEKPKEGEYRFLRFAWKRPDAGRGAMVQLCLSSGEWGRYFAGENVVGFYPALQLSPKAPREWEMVTRDLYADFGRVPFILTGFAFTSMDGVALFDHVYLGRTIEDLDRVTNAARNWGRRTEALGTAQLENHWKDLASEDAAVRMPALWALGACGKSSVPFVADRVTVPGAAETARRIRTALVNLDAPRYAVRERADKELAELGLTALPHLEAALPTATSAELRSRLEKLIAKCKADEGLVLIADQRLTLRTIRVLELADTAESRKLLEEMSAGGLAAGLSGEAKSALERMDKRRK